MSGAVTAGGPIPVFDSLDVIKSQVTACAHPSLFLDFDGTISEIVPNPEDAEIEASVRPALSRLVRRPDLPVAIVSGRELANVRARAGIEHIIYAGNHGLEIEGCGVQFREPRAEALRHTLKSVISKLELALAGVKGARIEDKGLSASVHYRGVEESQQDLVHEITCEVASHFPDFLIRKGKKVSEVRPLVDWNKGHAVRWILTELCPISPLPIYIGDDATDEDAFAAIPQGITIKVGRQMETNARYTLCDVAAVGQFLGWLDHTRR